MAGHRPASPRGKAGKHDVRGTFGLEIVENGYVAHSTRRIKEDGRAKRLVIKLIIFAITIEANTRSGGERSGERERGITNSLGIAVSAILLSRDPAGHNVRYNGQSPNDRRVVFRSRPANTMFAATVVLK